MTHTSDLLHIAGKTYASRLLTGTGKFKDLEETRLATEAAGAQIVTVAIRRTNIGQNPGEPNLLDVLPPEITAEREGLQDEVPPVPFPAVRVLAESELGAPLEKVFAWINETPIAAASLGQAYAARLLPSDTNDTGLANVVLKVQRPGIDAIIAVDLAALRKVAG